VSDMYEVQPERERAQTMFADGVAEFLNSRAGF